MIKAAHIGAALPRPMIFIGLSIAGILGRKSLCELRIGQKRKPESATGCQMPDFTVEPPPLSLADFLPACPNP